MLNAPMSDLGESAFFAFFYFFAGFFFACSIGTMELLCAAKAKFGTEKRMVKIKIRFFIMI